MTGPILTTERLILTPVTVADYDDLLPLWQDEAFTAHTTGRALSGEEVWFRLLRDIGHWSALGHGNWSLRLKDGGAYAGAVGVLDYRRDLEPTLDAPEMGWGLVTAFHGQGFAHEALTAVLDWVDTALGAHRTVCMIDLDNAPSRRLAERVGYTTYAQTTYKEAQVTLFERLRP